MFRLALLASISVPGKAYVVRQATCRTGSAVTINGGSSSTFLTPNFPALYLKTSVCTWTFTAGSGSTLSVYCAGSVPCTDSFTIVASPSVNKTFCSSATIAVPSVGPSVSITLKPGSTSLGGAAMCYVMATPVATTSLPATTKPPNVTTTPVKTTVAPAITTPKPMNGTVAPVMTTPKPINGTVAPVVTTLKPINGTMAPVMTTPKPMNGTMAPAVTTQKPANGTTPAITTKPPTSNCTCGIQGPAANRIVGGSAAGQQQFPWIVMLLENGAGPFCGGSIIAPGWVATAVHCIEGTDLSTVTLSVMAGRYSISTPSATEQLRDVVQIIQHPAWDTNTFDNDIALLKLKTPFTFTSAVAPICLPMKFPNFDFANTTGIAAGWGTTTSGGTQPDSLLQVTLPILSSAQCRNYPTVADGITNNMICTYTAGKDTCQGDSGGPLGWVDPVSKRTFLAGITSWGVGCADVNAPGVYAKVNNYLTWIQQTTGQTYCSP